MRVLGVDPGLTRCGVGVVDSARGRRAELVAVGVIRTDPELSVDLRLLRIAERLDAWFDEHVPDVVAVERVFAQHNVASVMGTAQVSGIALMLAAERGLPTATHTPSEVKAAITGYGSADKAQVQHMVARVLRLAELPKPADAADALAIALCHAWRRGPVSSGPSPSGTTPAQRAWAEAEKKSRVARTKLRNSR